MSRRHDWFVAIAALLCGGCGGCGSDTRDASVDAAHSDVTPDRALVDASLDVPGDLAALDVTPSSQPQACAPDDAGDAAPFPCDFVDTGDGRWARLSCAPTSCELRAALHPEREVGALAWQPCSNGLRGCRELVPSPPFDPDAGDRIDARGAATAAGVWLWLARESHDATGVIESALLPEEGGAAVAVYTYVNQNQATDCFGGGLAAMPEGAVATGFVPTVQPQLTTTYIGGYAAGTPWSSPFVTFDTASCGQTLPTHFAIAGDDAVIGFDNGSLRQAHRGAPRTRLLTNSTMLGTSPLLPHLLNGWVYFEGDAFGRNMDLWIMPLQGGPPRALIATQGTDYFGLAVDATQIAWLSGAMPDPSRAADGGTYYTGVSLWTAQRVTDPSQVQPRRVSSTRLTAPTSSSYPTAGFGRYVVPEDDGSMRVINLADGTSWLFTPAPGEVWLRAWISADEVAFGMRHRDDYPPTAMRALYRFRFSDLGAPLPALP